MEGTRRAVVTGAASGIGLAVALKLLSQGCTVLAADINRDGLRAVEAAGADTMVVDVGDADARQALISAGDGIDYLVNAAGIIRIKPIFELTVDEWRDIMRINAESTFFLCQGISPHMRTGGAIVNLSSSSAKLATTVELASYAATKTTILSITRSFAYALASRSIRVNAICPGIIDTPMQDKVLDGVAELRGTGRDELNEARNKSVPLGRSGTAEETADLVWFLLSPQSSYMTGQAINLTGGLVVW